VTAVCYKVEVTATGQSGQTKKERKKEKREKEKERNKEIYSSV